MRERCAVAGRIHHRTGNIGETRCRVALLTRLVSQADRNRMFESAWFQSGGYFLAAFAIMSLAIVAASSLGS